MKEVKYYCDICNCEGIESNFRKFSIDERHPLTRVFTTVVPVQIYSTDYDICSECWEEMLDLIEKLKNKKKGN